ncbi:MAG: hypothetical protein GX751_07415 [Desulfuromonadaceae bacterium]|nr:hypothetical protein [Desulfuromonadaceae bacterium]
MSKTNVTPPGIPQSVHRGGIRIEINQQQLDHLKASLWKIRDGATVVLRRAINDTLTGVKTDADREVRAVYNLKSARVKKDFKLRRATDSNLSGAFVASGEPVGLFQFGAKQNKKGVSVKVLKSEPRKTVRHAFIRIPATRAYTGRQVFWRAKEEGKMVGRDPLHRLEGPRIEDALAKPEVQKALEQKASERLNKYLDHETSYLLGQA